MKELNDDVRRQESYRSREKMPERVYKLKAEVLDGLAYMPHFLSGRGAESSKSPVSSGARTATASTHTKSMSALLRRGRHGDNKQVS